MERDADALTDFNRAIDLDPDNAWAIAYRGETHRLMERDADALTDFNRVIELDPNIAADFRNSPLSITGIPQGTSGAEGLG